MHSIFLIDIIESVPVCAQTVSLSALMEIFIEAGCDRLVVVNQAQSPLGLVSLQKFLPILLAMDALPSSPMRVAKAFNPTQISLQELCLVSDVPFLTPLGILSSDLSLSQFATIAQGTSYFATEHALVNPSGEFLGLLNRPQLLKMLAHSLPHSKSLPSGVKTRVGNDRTQLRPPLNLNPADLDPVQVTLKSVLKLLEQLPLPLMLQTGEGRVLVQNSVWHQQVGKLQDPAWIREEAATLLEPASLRSAPLARDRAAERATQFWGMGGEIMTEATVANLCQIGTNANTCVCACPMKDGEDRIWEFTKIPLDLSMPEMIPQMLAATLGLPTASAPTWSVESFRLAALVNTLSGDTDSSSEAEAGMVEDLWLVLAQDKTEQQQVARELAAKNADLVQLNRMKDEFLACISHELKTPLTAILGLSNLLNDQRLGSLNERQARYAGLIHQSGRHLVTMVNDILDLTHMETGQLELLLEPVSILAICDRVCQKVQQQDAAVGAGGVKDLTALPQRISLEIEPGLGMIVADELRLHQMLTNLLSNALKFTPGNGKVGLTVSAWEGWIAFKVWDTGIGIPADKQHLIFQKFQQLENPLTRRFEGTGLGLVLTQRLARLHGGEITFVSKEGQGSEFTLLLPPSSPWQDTAGQVKSGGGADVASRSKDRTGGTGAINRLILVVEAVPRFVEDLTDRLLGLGYRVVIARSGTEAIEKVRRLQPRVVLLNPFLPLLSGWDVLTLLKSDAETRHIPVVMTAAKAERNQALRNQADDFLSLPIETEALQQTLTRLDFHSPAQPEPQPSLTILLLGSGEATQNHSYPNHSEGCGSDLSQFLRSHHHRILEVDDIDQARMLAQVWKPHVLLLDAQLSDSPSLLKTISQSALLSALPVVTLTTAMTQAANEFPNLSVFPCLGVKGDPIDATLGNSAHATTSVLQVLHIAAGLKKSARILAIDLSTMTLAKVAPMAKQSSDWLQALIQYVQVAGLTAVIGRSWAEVLHQLQHQSADLLLICVRDTTAITDSISVAALVRALSAIEQLPAKPPILVLSQTCIPNGAGQPQRNPSESWNLMPAVEAIATRILPTSLSMAELLAEIKQIV